MATNLTPHPVSYMPHDGASFQDDRGFTLPPFPGGPARVNMSEAPAPPACHGCPAIRRVPGGVILPPGIPEEGWLIVSSMVLDAAAREGHPLLGRMCAPDTGPTARRESGQVVAVTRFVVA